MIPAPNYTQTPNVIFDNMSQMTNSEFKVICAIARQTFGWHKRTDRLSISQIVAMTGLSHRGVIYAIQSLLERDFIVRYPDGNGFQYGINVAEIDEDGADSAISAQEVVQSVHRDSAISAQEVVQSVHTQKKPINKHKESSSSSSDGDYAEIAQIAMSSGIYIGQIQSEMLADFIDEYGAANVKNAIAIAAGNGKLTLNYIGGILRRQRNGTAPQAKRTSTNNTNKEKDNGKDLLDGWLPINRTEIVGGADEPIDIDSITF